MEIIQFVMMELQALASVNTWRISGTSIPRPVRPLSTFHMSRIYLCLLMDGVTRAAWLFRDKGRWKMGQDNQLEVDLHPPTQLHPSLPFKCLMLLKLGKIQDSCNSYF